MAKEASAIGANAGRTVVRRNLSSFLSSLVIFPLFAGAAAGGWGGLPAFVVTAAAVLGVLLALFRADSVTLAHGELRHPWLFGLRTRRIPVAVLTVESLDRSSAASSIVFSSACERFSLSLFRTRKGVEWYPRDQIKNLVFELDRAGALVRPSAWVSLGLAASTTKPMSGEAIKVRLGPVPTVAGILLLGTFLLMLSENGLRTGNPAAVAALVLGGALLGVLTVRLLFFNYVQADGLLLRSVKFNGSSHGFLMSSVRVSLGRWMYFQRIEFSSGVDKFSLALVRSKLGDAWPRRRLKQLIAVVAASGAEVDPSVLDLLDDW